MAAAQKQKVLGYTLTDKLIDSTYYNEKTLYYSDFALSIPNVWATRSTVHAVHV